MAAWLGHWSVLALGACRQAAVGGRPQNPPVRPAPRPPPHGWAPHAGHPRPSGSEDWRHPWPGPGPRDRRPRHLTAPHHCQSADPAAPIDVSWCRRSCPPALASSCPPAAAVHPPWLAAVHPPQPSTRLPPLTRWRTNIALFAPRL